MANWAPKYVPGKHVQNPVESDVQPFKAPLNHEHGSRPDPVDPYTIDREAGRTDSAVNGAGMGGRGAGHNAGPDRSTSGANPKPGRY